MSESASNPGSSAQGNGQPFSINSDQAAVIQALVDNTLLSRIDLIKASLDPRRDIDKECGYPPINRPISVWTYRQLYERLSTAERVVQVWAKECWQVQPRVEDTPSDNGEQSEFVKAFIEMSQGLGSGKSWYEDEENSPVWNDLMKADALSGIGQFGILLLGLDDGKPLSEPVDNLVTVNADGSTVWHNMMPDSPISETEEQLIRSGSSTEEVWDIDGRKFQLTKVREPLTANQLREVDGWAQQRQLVLNKVGPGDPLGGVYGSPSPTGGPQAGVGYGSYVWDMYGYPNYGGVGYGSSQNLPDKPSGKKRKLLFLRAFDESLVEIVRYEWNVRNPRFGLPIMYRVTINDPRQPHGGVGQPLASVFVHWSRVIHICESTESSPVYTKARMRPVLNHLLDLYKLYGASAEMYYKGALPGLSIESHPALGGDVRFNESQMKDRIEQYQNGLQRYMFTAGFHVNSLSPQVVDPSPQIDVHLTAICIELEIPKRVFMGSERGELASGQDDASWNDRVRSRENMYVTPYIIVPFIDRLILLGVLPEPKKYRVTWPDLDSQTEDGRAGIAMKRTQAMAQYCKAEVHKLMGPVDYLVNELGYTLEVAQAITEDADGFDQPSVVDIGAGVRGVTGDGNGGVPGANPQDLVPEVDRVTGQKKTTRSADKPAADDPGGTGTLKA